MMDRWRHLSTVFLLLATLTRSQSINKEVEFVVPTVINNRHSEKLMANGDEHFHCDLLLTPEQERSLYDPNMEATRESYEWPKNKKGFVTVPYRIAKSSKFCKL